MKGFELILKSKKMILREYWWSFIAFWLVWIAFIGVDAFIALKFSSALIQLSLNVVIDGIVGLLVLRFCLWLLKTLGYKHLGKRTVIIIFFVAIAGGICNGILYMSSAKLVTSMHLFSEDNNKSFLNWGDKYNFFIDTNEKGRLEDWRRNFPEGFFSVFSFILFYYLLEYRRKSNQLEQNQSRLERELSFLEEEKIKAEEELAIRSSQLKPHWMLNMLQNIKILIKRSPDRSIEMIEDLQELTRYMVYEYAESQKKVNLAKEINFLKSYTNLVKKVHGEIIDFKEHKYNPNLEIAPMILIIFMENAINLATLKSV